VLARFQEIFRRRIARIVPPEQYHFTTDHPVQLAVLERRLVVVQVACVKLQLLGYLNYYRSG
jgi:hypothetical protein